MNGTITSTDPTCDASGVPLRKILDLTREANDRLIDRQRAVLERWLDWATRDWKSPNSAARQRIKEDLVKQTQMVLG